jgi:hypothetical protein
LSRKILFESIVELELGEVELVCDEVELEVELEVEVEVEVACVSLDNRNSSMVI